MGTDDNPRAGRLEDDVLIWSILKDIESLAVPAAVVDVSATASMAPVAEDPIVGLWRQVLDHRAEASRLDSLADEARKRGDDTESSRQSELQKDADNKWQSIEAEILQADALTAEGWAIQAELLADQSGEQMAERIAQHLRRMADAEQLAASGDV